MLAPRVTQIDHIVDLVEAVGLDPQAECEQQQAVTESNTQPRGARRLQVCFTTRTHVQERYWQILLLRHSCLAGDGQTAGRHMTVKPLKPYVWLLFCQCWCC